ncbi:MAG: Zn-ribbon domain-containing OB-fold protein [Pseudomonadota bacterium]
MQTLEAHYEAEARAGRLALRACRGCGDRQAFARPFCPACGSDEVEWLTSSGRGRVAAVTVIHRAPTPDYRERVPYAIVLVDLDEGPRVMGHGSLDLAIGQPVRAGFEAHGERHLLVFTAAGGAGR